LLFVRIGPLSAFHGSPDKQHGQSLPGDTTPGSFVFRGGGHAGVLAKAESIPSDLKRFVQDKAEGNPFYLEELINSLIESEALVQDNGSWKITRAISESDISPTIHGLISGRLDRLERETKRILQEASVIGRAFLYDILKRITELDDRVDQGTEHLGTTRFYQNKVVSTGTGVYVQAPSDSGGGL
jgi:predicted ATPase